MRDGKFRTAFTSSDTGKVPWIYIILIITGLASTVTVFGTARGNLEIVSYVFYIPIILTAYFFPRFGVISSIALGAFYIVLNVPFASDIAEISKLFLISGLFVGIGGIVSILSENLYLEKKKYKGVFQAGGTGIILFGRKDFRIIEVNPRILHTLGYSRDEIVGTDFGSLWTDPEAKDRFLAKITPVGGPGEVETEFRDKSGVSVQVVLSATGIDDEIVLCTVTDITHQGLSGFRPGEYKKGIKAVFGKVPIGLAIFDHKGDMISANVAVRQILGIEEGVSPLPVNLFDLNFLPKNERESLEKGEYINDVFSVHMDQLRRMLGVPLLRSGLLVLDIRIAPISFGSLEKVDGYIAILEDITDRIQREDALFRAKDRYLTIFERSADPVIIHDLEGMILEISDSARDVLGYPPGEILGRSLDGMMDPESRLQRSDRMNELKERGTARYEAMLTSREGISIPVEISSRVIIYGDKPAIVSIARDITARRKFEEDLKSTLDEKVVQLKEVHHRVKNNMQVITSLIQLESSGVAKPEFSGHFESLEQRVRSMAIVHEMLYRSQNLAFIDAGLYLQRLVSGIFELSPLRDSVRVTYEVDEISLDVNTAIPCGLIVNELVTNTLKYAYKGRMEGTLLISMNKAEGGKYRMVVKDDGPGLPESFDLNQSTTLGMQLIDVLVRQLDGQIRISCANGALVEIEFPAKRK